MEYSYLGRVVPAWKYVRLEEQITSSSFNAAWNFRCLGFNLMSGLQTFLSDWILMAEKTIELYFYCNYAMPNVISQQFVCVDTAYLSFIKLISKEVEELSAGKIMNENDKDFERDT